MPQMSELTDPLPLPADAPCLDLCFMHPAFGLSTSNSRQVMHGMLRQLVDLPPAHGVCPESCLDMLTHQITLWYTAYVCTSIPYICTAAFLSATPMTAVSGPCQGSWPWAFLCEKRLAPSVGARHQPLTNSRRARMYHAATWSQQALSRRHHLWPGAACLPSLSSVELMDAQGSAALPDPLGHGAVPRQGLSRALLVI